MCGLEASCSPNNMDCFWIHTGRGSGSRLTIRCNTIRYLFRGPGVDLWHLCGVNRELDILSNSSISSNFCRPGFHERGFSSVIYMYILSTLYERFSRPVDIRFWPKLEDKKTKKNMRYQIFSSLLGKPMYASPSLRPQDSHEYMVVMCRIVKKNRCEKRAACFCLACFRVLLSESLAEAKFTRRRQFSPLLTRISVDSLSPGGDSQCKSDRDARRLAFGCNLQILVSLRVFVKESYYSCPFRYRLVLCIKKFTNKKCPDTDHTEISPRGRV